MTIGRHEQGPSLMFWSPRNPNQRTYHHPLWKCTVTLPLDCLLKAARTRNQGLGLRRRSVVFLLRIFLLWRSDTFFAVEAGRVLCCGGRARLLLLKPGAFVAAKAGRGFLAMEAGRFGFFFVEAGHVLNFLLLWRPGALRERSTRERNFE